MFLALYNDASADLQKHGISCLLLCQIKESEVHGYLPAPMAMAQGMIYIYGMNPSATGLPKPTAFRQSIGKRCTRELILLQVVAIFMRCR